MADGTSSQSIHQFTNFSLTLLYTYSWIIPGFALKIHRSDKMNIISVSVFILSFLSFKALDGIRGSYASENDYKRFDDMLLTSRQYNQIDSGQLSGINDLSFRWTNGEIPYKIEDINFNQGLH